MTRIPEGPLDAIPDTESSLYICGIKKEELSEDQLREQSVNALSHIASIKAQKIETSLRAIDATYIKAMNKMSVHDDDFGKMIKERVFSIALHPSQKKTLVFVGDKEVRVIRYI